MPAVSAPALQTLTQQQDDLLAGWIREQLAANSSRPDLISENELRRHSSQLLVELAKALQTGGGADIHSPHYTNTLEILADLSRSRGRLGFSPSETAMFIFSLKQPLLADLRKAHGSDLATFVDDSAFMTQLLDKLGLYTTEMFQQAREEVIRRQQEEMLELSTPVVRLWEGILALPLIGTLDSARTSIVMETLLQTIVETGSEIAIIDITGVPTVDTLVAQHLLKTVAAARLMGADCLISGIRPQIAQTMVHLQIDLSSVTTKTTMAEALSVALKKTGYKIISPKTSAKIEDLADIS